jgi:hypothetical protein
VDFKSNSFNRSGFLSILLIVSMLSVACAQSFPTTHPDPQKNNSITYKADMRDCAESYPESADGIYLKRRLSCMELKGWK